MRGHSEDLDQSRSPHDRGTPWPRRFACSPDSQGSRKLGANQEKNEQAHQGRIANIAGPDLRSFPYLALNILFHIDPRGDRFSRTWTLRETLRPRIILYAVTQSASCVRSLTSLAILPLSRLPSGLFFLFTHAVLIPSRDAGSMSW